MRDGVQSNQSHQGDLIKAIQANDTVVLQKLYSENYPKVEAHILRNNGNKAQAKDVFQEAMIALWRAVKSEKFQAINSSAVQGYLYTIAKNKWIDYLRSSGYKKEVSSELVMTNWGEVDEEEEDSDYEVKLKLARDAFKQLGENCRVLLSKFYFEKKSMEAIAEILKLDAASTRNKKYRCMQKLRAMVIPVSPQKVN